MSFRVGQGYDAHKLVEGRKLVLGGVEVPFARGLLGHSDADVLCHAVCDALLGAAGLGDIGGHFPDCDMSYEGVSSLKLLRQVAGELTKAGCRVINIDSTIVAQEPKISPYVEQMERNVAEAVNIPVSCVNIKGKTTEGLGFVGACLGIEAQAVALIEMAD